MNLIRGSKGLFPCPKCLVPREALSDLSTIYLPRTAAATLEIREAAKAQKTAKASEFLLQSFGLRPIDVCVTILHFSDTHLITNSNRMPLMIFLAQTIMQPHLTIHSTLTTVAFSMIIWNLSWRDWLTNIMLVLRTVSMRSKLEIAFASRQVCCWLCQKQVHLKHLAGETWTISTPSLLLLLLMGLKIGTYQR